MTFILKKPTEYILVNGQYTTSDKVVYDDYLSEHGLIEGDVFSIEKVLSSNVLTTPYSDHLCKKYQLVLSKDAYDFSEDLYKVTKIEDLKIGDYLFLYRKLPMSFRSSVAIDISEYLYLGTYDISTVSKDLCKNIGVPKSFLIQSLRTGVPDNEYYNEKLNSYLFKEGYETTEDFKKQLFEESCRQLKKRLIVDKYFFKLIVLLLSDRYSFDEDLTIFDIKDLDSYFIEDIISFLDNHLIPFTNEDRSIICNSSFLLNLFKNEFNNLSFLSHLAEKFDKELSELFVKQSFLTASNKTLNYVRQFLFCLGILSRIEKFNEELFILTIISPEEYITIPNVGYYLPITSIDTFEETVLQFNID